MEAVTVENNSTKVAKRELIKAVAVIPGKPNTIHLREVPSRRCPMYPTGAACS